MIKRLLFVAAFICGGCTLARAEEPTYHKAPTQAAATDNRYPFNQTPEKMAEINRQARMRMAQVCAAEGDVLGWGKALFPDKFELPFCNELHGYFVTIRRDPFTNTEAPRGFAKTTIKCFLIPLYQALVEPKSYIHYLNVQSTEAKALTVNLAIRLELEENQELRALYGDQVSRTKWTDKQFVLNNGVIFTAVGAGQSIRGLHYRNIRPQYVIVDDLYDEDDIHNVESTGKKTQWFWGSLFKALAKGRATSLHVQGTAINNYDLLKELATKDRWKSRTFRGIKNFDTKEVLWAEHTTFDSFMADLADMPTVIFNREIQNERHDDAESIIKSKWLVGWEYNSIPDDHIVVAVVLGVDPSIGEKEINDATGVVLVVKTRHKDALAGAAEYWIEDVWEERISLDQRVKLLNRIRESYDRPITLVNIEAVAGFKDFAAEVARRTPLPVRSVAATKDKIAHLESKSHHFENHRVHLRAGIDKKKKDTIVYQLTNNKPKHDDVRDALLLTMDGAKSGTWRPIA